MRLFGKMNIACGVIVLVACITQSAVGIRPVLDVCPACYKGVCDTPGNYTSLELQELPHILYSGLFHNESAIREQYNVPDKCALVCYPSDQIRGDSYCDWNCGTGSTRGSCTGPTSFGSDGSNCCMTCLTPRFRLRIKVASGEYMYVVHAGENYQVLEEAKCGPAGDCFGQCSLYYATRPVLVSDTRILTASDFLTSTFSWEMYSYPSHCYCVNSHNARSMAAMRSVSYLTLIAASLIAMATIGKSAHN